MLFGSKLKMLRLAIAGMPRAWNEPTREKVKYTSKNKKHPSYHFWTITITFSGRTFGLINFLSIIFYDWRESSNSPLMLIFLKTFSNNENINFIEMVLDAPFYSDILKTIFFLFASTSKLSPCLALCFDIFHEFI